MTDCAIAERIPFAIPRTPLFSWDWILWRSGREGFRPFGVEGGQFVGSGRAAIYWALELTAVGRGDAVLVPTYHCPTVVAPVVQSGATPVFYPLTAEGIPDVRSLDRLATRDVRAMIVPQLFGLPRDLSEIRKWCDSSGIAMIEDCAHTLFGKAGSRHVGQWGDYATASLAKFLPVSELGWLTSASKPIARIPLASCGWLRQVKAILDPVELAAVHGRLGAIGRSVRKLNGLRRQARHDDDSGGKGALEMLDLERAMASCNMGRVAAAPALASCWFAIHADLAAIAVRRRRNFDRMAEIFRDCAVGRLLAERSPADSGPYVMPVLVDDADRLYVAMRQAGFPAYRWDRLWPGTPVLENDVSPGWWRGLLQIPVHQSYTDEDFDRMAALLARLKRKCGLDP